MCAELQHCCRSSMLHVLKKQYFSFKLWIRVKSLPWWRDCHCIHYRNKMRRKLRTCDWELCAYTFDGLWECLESLNGESSRFKDECLIKSKVLKQCLITFTILQRNWFAYNSLHLIPSSSEKVLSVFWFNLCKWSTDVYALNAVFWQGL